MRLEIERLLKEKVELIARTKKLETKIQKVRVKSLERSRIAVNRAYSTANKIGSDSKSRFILSKIRPTSTFKRASDVVVEQTRNSLVLPRNEDRRDGIGPFSFVR